MQYAGTPGGRVVHRRPFRGKPERGAAARGACAVDRPGIDECEYRKRVTGSPTCSTCRLFASGTEIESLVNSSNIPQLFNAAQRCYQPRRHTRLRRPVVASWGNSRRCRLASAPALRSQIERREDLIVQDLIRPHRIARPNDARRVWRARTPMTFADLLCGAPR